MNSDLSQKPGGRSAGIPFWAKALLSVFIIYHLICVMILPNPSSLLGRKLGRYLIPYANVLGLNTTWQFFSPGPVPIFFFEYDVEMTDSPDFGVSETQFYPPRLEPRTWGDFYKRRRASASYFAMAPDWIGRYLAPYLCRQHPGAYGINLRAVLEPTTEMERMNEWSTSKDLSQRIDLPRQHFACEREGSGQDSADDSVNEINGGEQ